MPLPPGTRELPQRTPDFDQQIGAATRNAAGSALVGTTAVGMGLAGATYGAPVAPPWGAVVGGVLGAGTGLILSTEAREKLARDPFFGRFIGGGPQMEPPDVRDWAWAGETFGGGLPFVGLPYAAAYRGMQAAEVGLGRFVNEILRKATTAPKQFISSEMATLGTASTASKMAETLFPGEMDVQIGAQVAGGFLSPGGLFGNMIVGQARNTIGTIKSAFSESGRMNTASMVLREALEQAGEDPAAIARALREVRFADVPESAATRSNNATMVMLERRLAKDNKNFDAERKELADNGLEALRLLAQRLEETGDPKNLAAAAKVRGDWMRSYFRIQMEGAAERAKAAAGKISSDDPRDVRRASEVARQTLADALKNSREAEAELWAKVNHALPADGTSIAETYAAIKAQQIPGETLPAMVEGLPKKMLDSAAVRDQAAEIGMLITEQPTTTGELINFRGRMLEFGRQATADKKFVDARYYGELAEAALDDLERIGAKDAEYNAARAFSRNLHDSFTRTYAGEALSKKATGAKRIPPELVLNKAFGAGGLESDIKFDQLDKAVEFASRLPKAAGELTDRMTTAQDRFLRLMAMQTVDPETGRVRPDLAKNFLDRNMFLLDKFPKVRQELTDARGAALVFNRLEKSYATAARKIENEAAFPRLIGTENTPKVIRGIINSDAPVAEMEKLIRFANRDPAKRQAMNGGLTSAVLGYAREAATSDTGFSWARYQSALNSPLPGGKESLIDVLTRTKVMKPEVGERLNLILNEVSRIEGAMNAGVALDKLSIAMPDALYDLALRVAGSNLAGPTAQTTSAPLVVGAAGSRMMRTIFDKVPRGKVQHILEEAAKDPETMALLLERPTTKVAREKLGKQINAFLWDAGLLAPTKGETGEGQ